MGRYLTNHNPFTSLEATPSLELTASVLNIHVKDVVENLKIKGVV